MKIKTLLIWITGLATIMGGVFFYTFFLKVSPWTLLKNAFSQSLLTPDRTRLPDFLFTLGNSPDDTQGFLSGPLGVAADGKGTTYVANTRKNQIMTYDQNGKLLTVFGKAGNSSGQLTYPIDVAVVERHILVTEAINRRVQIFDLEGKFVKVFLDVKTDPEIGNIQPVGIGVGKGRVFVTDALGHRVIIMDTNGKFIGTLGKPGSGNGEFSYPYDVAVDATGKIFVSDANNGRVQVFDQDGKFLHIIKGPGKGQSFSLPRGLAFDNYNRLMVVDVFLHQVLFFEPDGTFLFAMGSRGKEDKQFNFPNGIGTGGGRIFIADRDNHRVAVYKP